MFRLKFLFHFQDSLLFENILCSHYFVNGGFFDSDNHLIDGSEKIRHIPGTIVQGRYDMACPVRTAWDLHKVYIDIFTYMYLSI